MKINIPLPHSIPTSVISPKAPTFNILIPPAPFFLSELECQLVDREQLMKVI